MTDEPDDESEAAPRGRLIDRGVIVVGLLVLGAAGYFIYRQKSARGELEAGRGHPSGAVVSGGTLVVIDRVSAPKSAPAYRLAAIDAATGKPGPSRVIDEQEKCWPASQGKIWCADDAGNLHLLAVPSLETAQETPDDTKARQIAEPRCALADSLPIGDDHLTFGDGAQRPLMRHTKHEAGVEPMTESLPGTPTFRSPSFLVTGDPALLVIHDAALERPGDRQLSRVSDDLKLSWTVDLPASCETATAAAGRLVITTTDPKHRALAVDLQTGKIAWEFGMSDSR